MGSEAAGTVSAGEILITFGALFLVGLLADLAGRRTPLPRVSVLLLTGFAIGPSALDWLPSFTAGWFPLLTSVALTMIGFLLGHAMTRRSLRTVGTAVVVISVAVLLTTVLMLALPLAAFGVPIVTALLLAGVGPATDPAATADVVRELGARGRFTDTLLGIVAIDDALGLLAFSLLLATAGALTGEGNAGEILFSGLREIAGGVLLGVALGFPMAYLTGRIRTGEPTQAEALGLVLLCAGLAMWAGVSHILSAMVLGATVANLAKHHNRPFRAIEGIEWPFMILFFLLAGASLRLDSLTQVGLIGTAYIVLRTAGRVIGGWIGAKLCATPPETGRIIGLSLLPQAGVAIGMALLAIQRFPEQADIILPVVLGSTVVFELVGPVVTRQVLLRTGEARS